MSKTRLTRRNHPAEKRPCKGQGERENKYKHAKSNIKNTDINYAAMKIWHKKQLRQKKLRKCNLLRQVLATDTGPARGSPCMKGDLEEYAEKERREGERHKKQGRLDTLISLVRRK